jgi:hypothetical protein
VVLSKLKPNLALASPKIVPKFANEANFMPKLQLSSAKTETGLEMSKIDQSEAKTVVNMKSTVLDSTFKDSFKFGAKTDVKTD